MAQATHQTARLVKGRHQSPDQGACTMELASMLAGERFSDRPACVDPVIGAFLRAYDDGLDGECRRALYRYAAQVVGSRAPRAVERERIEHCLEWAARRGAVARGGRWARHRRRCELAGARAAEAALRLPERERAQSVDALLCELCTIGAERARTFAGLGQPLSGRSPSAHD